MVVLEKALSKYYPEIDMVTTPAGAPVAMVHCNNCTSDINAWVNLLSEFAEFIGAHIQVEIGEICRNIGNYKSQIEIERQNRSNAELAYDISLEKYANGDLTAMDLNLYQTQLSNRRIDRKSTRLNSSHQIISYAVFCLK